ncbi:hypothetical protein FZEAL_10711 [Fusarium zealandicum]|uniref:Uncharacterized protein n=1 Tax=Fusarium zealandicum TaxID=1053134 RepID=A0A8H4TXJ0_9HYPO|nr:hypothetical protein FZEAL_10711 [Fusarium zealandicum]
MIRIVDTAQKSPKYLRRIRSISMRQPACRLLIDDAYNIISPYQDIQAAQVSVGEDRFVIESTIEGKQLVQVWRQIRVRGFRVGPIGKLFVEVLHRRERASKRFRRQAAVEDGPARDTSNTDIFRWGNGAQLGDNIA